MDQIDLTRKSQQLRKSMTKQERHLWYDFLKKLPVTVNRQKVIGRYIVDFVVWSSSLAIIEVDGAQHYNEAGREADAVRDEFLASKGFTVLRYTNQDVNSNFEGVCTDILKHLGVTWDEYCRFNGLLDPPGTSG